MLLFPELCHYFGCLQQAAIWTSILRSSLRVTTVHSTTHAKWPEPPTISAEYCSKTKWKIVHVPDFSESETTVWRDPLTLFSWCLERHWTRWLWCWDREVSQQSGLYRLGTYAIGFMYFFLFHIQVYPNLHIISFLIFQFIYIWFLFLRTFPIYTPFSTYTRFVPYSWVSLGLIFDILIFHVEACA